MLVRCAVQEWKKVPGAVEVSSKAGTAESVELEEPNARASKLEFKKVNEM
jgi:hypothetical protein